MKTKLEFIIGWLKDSGLKVNASKTEMCLFYRKDQPSIEITLTTQTIKSKTYMKVLGVSFDSKLNWQFQIENSITKAKRALNAIKLIRKHFNKQELLKLITSNYYSILYYNSEIWHLPSNTPNSKKQLLSASALPLKLCMFKYDRNTSFLTLHKLLKRTTPHQFMLYKHTLLLHKIYNDNTRSPEWLDLFMNQTFNNRLLHANFVDMSNFKIGKNIQSNRFHPLNNKISYNSLNLNYIAFKIHCKKLMIDA